MHAIHETGKLRPPYNCIPNMKRDTHSSNNLYLSLHICGGLPKKLHGWVACNYDTACPVSNRAQKMLHVSPPKRGQ